MTRLSQLSGRELIRFLRKQGFVEERQTGSHLILRHEARKVSVTIPVHSGVDIGRGLAVRILKDAGFSADDTMKFRRAR